MADSSVDGITNAMDRKDLFGQTGLSDGAGHTPDDATCLVLRQNPSASLHNLVAPTQTVTSHSCEHNSQHFPAERLHRAAE
jgi:hypothetical protein